MRFRWLGVLLPVTSSIVFISLMAKLERITFRISLTRDLDVIVILIGALISVSAAVGLIIRESAEQVCQQRLKRARAQAAAQRQRFLSRLDHEMKNPLTAIRAGLANLSGTENPQVRGEIRQTIEVQTQRVNKLLASLRKLADTDAPIAEPTVVDVPRLLREAMELTQDMVGASGRELSLQIPNDPMPLVMGDQDLLLLAVLNLLDNALKYTRDDDNITLRTFSKNEAFVVIEVEDTGPGIDEADMLYVWEELYRGRGVLDIPGSGIGLALVRSIINQHGGESMLVSQQGRGTTITLCLPQHMVASNL